MRPNRILATLVLAAVLALGCGGTGPIVQKGIDRYERLDYPGAAGEFARLSGRDADMNSKGLVRYYVYNGLTAYHLGYRDQAYALLTRGKALYTQGTASWLKPSVASEMDAALATLSGGAPLPTPAPPGGGPTIIIVPAR